MYKNLIFDCGKVLIDYDPYDIVEYYIKDREDLELVVRVMYDRIYWDRLDADKISDEELKEECKKRLPERLHKAACDAYDHWYYRLPPVPGMYELVRDLKESGKYKLYLLSNISKTFSYNYDKNPDLKRVLPLFDGLVFSGRLGIVKPSKEIFNYTLEHFGLDAGECLFIDDNSANIAGAKNVGIDGYLFDGDAKRLRGFFEM